MSTTSRDDPTEAVDRPRPPPLSVAAVVSGARAEPSRFEVGVAPIVVGAGKDVDVVVADTAVSRRHVSLSAVAEGIRVEDLGSRNGTFYAGQRIGTLTVAPGATIAIGSAQIAFEAASLDETLPGARTELFGLIGASRATRKVIALVERIRGSLFPVLIEGESGTGKEVVARAIHASSSVADGPWHVVNCGAIPRELVASELFGHRRGAFTGATADREGAFDVAAGGTLFLDEIGEMPLELQPHLLRALETGEITPVGASSAHRVQVRVVAATHRDLDAAQRAGQFRQDLFYRLAVIRLALEPLRARPEDVAPLAAHFAAAAGIELPASVVARLSTFAWPGNARELRNAVQAYAALGTLPAWLSRDPDAVDAALRHLVHTERQYHDLKDELVQRFTALYLQQLLERTGGNQARAAELAGLERSYFRKLLAKHGGGAGGER